MNQPKILIVDDELLIRDLLYDFFASKDFQIQTANDAAEAMQLVEKHKDFDVVLTDIKLEGEDGLSFVDRIREQHPDLPVIVMTGYPSVESAIEALRKRVYDYVIKPFNINRLFATVKAASDEHNQDKNLTV
ncbi:MAG: response regulator [bacterium]|nr:response regulator [bacterium]